MGLLRFFPTSCACVICVSAWRTVECMSLKAEPIRLGLAGACGGLCLDDEWTGWTGGADAVSDDVRAGDVRCTSRTRRGATARAATASAALGTASQRAGRHRGRRPPRRSGCSLRHLGLLSRSKRSKQGAELLICHLANLNWQRCGADVVARQPAASGHASQPAASPPALHRALAPQTQQAGCRRHDGWPGRPRQNREVGG